MSFYACGEINQVDPDILAAGLFPANALKALNSPKLFFG